jgi:uncharacterized membrane-anchored protein YhcB (DUF1043 family)
MQSKLSSFMEAASQTLIGYVINLCVQLVIYPLYGATFTLQQNIEIGLIFLVVSLLRGYVIRRYFNKKAKHAQQQG